MRGDRSAWVRGLEMVKRLAAAAVGVVGLIQVADAADTMSPALAPLLAAAKSEGQINFSWGGSTLSGGDGVRRFEAGFNKFYGTAAHFNYTPGLSFPAQAQKLGEEKAAGQKAFMDIGLAGPGQVDFFLKSGLLMPMDWAPLLPNVPANVLKAITSNDGALIAFISRPNAFDYNTNLVPPAEAPKSLKELLDPKWKGKIATTPYAPGFLQLAVDPHWGQEKAIDYAKKFALNLVGFMRCGENDRLTSGEFAIFSLECEPERVIQLREQGAPVTSIIPQDAQEITYWWVGVPKNAENPNMAKLFIAWLLTPEGQKVLYQNQGADLHLLPGSHSAQLFAEAQKASGATFDDQNLQRMLSANVPQVEAAVAKIFREQH